MSWIRRLFRRGEKRTVFTKDADLRDAMERVQHLEEWDQERELRLRRLGLEVEIKRRRSTR